MSARWTDVRGWAVQVPAGYEVSGWRVRRPVATGAWGSVYEAERLGSGEPRRAALKFLPTGTLTPRQLTHLSEMVRREIDLHAELAHPRIVRLLGTATVDDPAHPLLDGCCVLVMELAACSVQDALDRAAGKGLPDGPRIVEQICEGLAHLHAAGRVHGDIKPSNVLLMPDGSVRLADFGLTTELESTHAYLAPMGSPDYMPPERWTEPLTERGVAIRPTADIWALGVTAHQILANRMPFPGGTPRVRASNAAQYAEGLAEPALSPELPEGWEAFVRDCLAPDDRQRSRWDAAALAGRASALRRDPTAQVRPPRRHPRRHPWRARAVGAAVGAAVLTAVAVPGYLALRPEPRGYGTWLNTESDIPPRYYDLVVDAGTRCDEPGVSPALVAAILKAESNWNPDLEDPVANEYGIARWTPAVLAYYLPPDRRHETPRPPFPPELSIPALGRYLCKYSSALQDVPGDRALLLAASYQSSDNKVRAARGVPATLRPYYSRVYAALLAYRPPGSPPLAEPSVAGAAGSGAPPSPG